MRLRLKARQKRRLKRLLLRAAFLVIGLLLAVNLPIRFLGGGDPNPLSPLHMKSKLRALGLFAWHGVKHPFSDCGEDLRPTLIRTAKRHGVPKWLVLRVAEVESGTRSHRISRTGAMGVMQLMPGTASDLNVGDPFDPQQNIDGGVRYLRSLWKRYKGDTRRVAAAYNAGPGRVPRRGPLSRLPSETQHYVRAVARR